jgi:hypothetical protein
MVPLPAPTRPLLSALQAKPVPPHGFPPPDPEGMSTWHGPAAKRERTLLHPTSSAGAGLSLGLRAVAAFTRACAAAKAQAAAAKAASARAAAAAKARAQAQVAAEQKNAAREAQTAKLTRLQQQTDALVPADKPVPAQATSWWSSAVNWAKGKVTDSDTWKCLYSFNLGACGRIANVVALVAVAALTRGEAGEGAVTAEEATAAGEGRVVYGQSQGVGQDLKRSATVGDDQWQFNTGHAFDRVHTGPDGIKNDLKTTTLSPDEVEQGIVNDVYGYVKGGGSVPRAGTPGFSGPLNRQIEVGGFKIGYRVVLTPSNVYAVGTYWLNP